MKKRKQQQNTMIMKHREYDPMYKMRQEVRKQLYAKDANAEEMLGCTYEEFRAYLGPKPEGKYDKDHICPLAQAQNEEELRKLQHHTNFRWMKHKENMAKSDCWTPDGAQKCRELLGREWLPKTENNILYSED